MIEVAHAGAAIIGQVGDYRMHAVVRGAMGAITVIVATTAAYGQSIESIPLRKVGQWETRINPSPLPLGPLVMQMCIDHATDRDLRAYSLTLTRGNCQKHDIRRDEQGWVHECVNREGVSRTTISGDFQSHITLRHEEADAKASTADGGQWRLLGTLTERWVSATCSSGMRPGDVLMGDRIKLRVRQVRELRPELDAKPTGPPTGATPDEGPMPLGAKMHVDEPLR
jgi:hypothetical protein